MSIEDYFRDEVEKGALTFLVKAKMEGEHPVLDIRPLYNEQRGTHIDYVVLHNCFLSRQVFSSDGSVV